MSGSSFKSQKEIERKFIIDNVPKDLDGLKHSEILQGYITYSEHGDVRVRKEGDEYLLTVKKGSGIERDETEVEISKGQFDRLWKSIERQVEKTRYEVPVGDHIAYIDVYKGKLEGLVVGEVEFKSIFEAKSFEAPLWFGRDVTEDEYYKNRNLSGMSEFNAQKFVRGLIEVPKYPLEKGIKEVLHDIDAMLKNAPGPVVVEIAGGSASGKTSAVADKVAESLGDQALKISMDDYYFGVNYMKRKEAEGIKLNFDQPEAIDLESLRTDIAALKEGRPISKPVYDFKIGETKVHEKIDPKGKSVIVLEGLFSLDNRLKGEGDLKVFVDVAMHDRIMRRIIRDADRTSWSFSQMVSYMLTVVEPMYRKYIEPERYNADIVISNPYAPMLEAMRIKSEERQIKYRIDKSVLAVVDKLEKMGAERLSDSEQEDYYFNPSDRDLMDSDEIVKVRKENGAMLFEYKGPRQKDGTRKRMMFEINEDTLAMMLSYYSLNFTIKKRRTTYRLFGTTLSLDRDVREYEGGNSSKAKKIGTFIEVKDGADAETLGKLQIAIGLKEGLSEPYAKIAK